MSLTPEQLARCQEVFERKAEGLSFNLERDKGGDYVWMDTDEAWQLAQAAWSAAQAGRAGELERAELALKPSSATKAALIGEFRFNVARISPKGKEYAESVTVPWTTIKEIMAAISKLAFSNSPEQSNNADAP